ncbi:unnamed protein product [Ciceribacter selenitireducens ATCC BAA-1503]|uniref:Uncharacterized protein n=1 Tax=Ciceribacter selenitireducens ATCC BAA-1503 TaxID=1336235 RepID=A0A376AD08_9HYPH|nr:unnamed protein product [Ciceribacter selenitireducens ATCC BAA-1503]
MLCGVSDALLHGAVVTNRAIGCAGQWRGHERPEYLRRRLRVRHRIGILRHRRKHLVEAFLGGWKGARTLFRPGRRNAHRKENGRGADAPEPSFRRAFRPFQQTIHEGTLSRQGYSVNLCSAIIGLGRSFCVFRCSHQPGLGRRPTQSGRIGTDGRRAVSTRLARGSSHARIAWQTRARCDGRMIAFSRRGPLSHGLRPTEQDRVNALSHEDHYVA